MSSSIAAMYVFSQVALAIAICHRIRKKSEPRKKGRPAARVRQRRSVQDVYECLGPTYFRRAYRMSYESFWILHDKLRDGIEEALKEKQTKLPDEGGKLHNRAPPIPNGPICTSVRLACAIRDIRRRRQLNPCQPRELLHERISNEHWKRPSRKVSSRGRR
ncbi:hypothetical protein IV203_003297 [Nitzschia inconspicua]|uniref:Uncharacterized protein n=1 Tax=Nitzschia inconspicua TaxID=303405 RepID=A0A9K3L399_9STRA|nr:hypothetical protein IV203_003297 [Nitzschia inconspicua]